MPLYNQLPPLDMQVDQPRRDQLPGGGMLLVIALIAAAGLGLSALVPVADHQGDHAQVSRRTQGLHVPEGPHGPGGLLIAHR